MPIFILLVSTVVNSLFKSCRRLILENLALRQQVAMLKQSVKRPRVSVADKLFWIFLSRYGGKWRELLHALHPDTVVRWHREGFRRYWRWKSRGPEPGRPPIDTALRDLIREMQEANIGWGAPRIHGELLKLGIEVSQATVSKYMRHLKKPPSQTWLTFLNNHADCLASIDFFTVPTATFRVLYVFIVLSRYLVRDRDGIYGELVQRRVTNLGIEAVVTAPKSPWQNPFVERFIGSIRRDRYRGAPVCRHRIDVSPARASQRVK